MSCAPSPGRFGEKDRRLTASLNDLASFYQVQGEYRRLKPAFGFDTLSMGMSDDLELAIAEGATMVRIGTAIFGARSVSARRAEKSAA